MSGLIPWTLRVSTVLLTGSPTIWATSNSAGVGMIGRIACRWRRITRRYTFDFFYVTFHFISLKNVDQQAKFVSEVFGRCLRLSYYKRVVEMVPECYAPLLPAKPDPYFKFQVEGGSGLPGSTQVQALTELLRKKPTPDEVLELVQQIPNPLKGKKKPF